MRLGACITGLSSPVILFVDRSKAILFVLCSESNFCAVLALCTFSYLSYLSSAAYWVIAAHSAYAVFSWCVPECHFSFFPTPPFVEW